MRKIPFLAVLAFFGFCSIAQAHTEAEAEVEAAAAADPSPWSGSVAAGYMKSTGNTEETNADADLAIIYTTKPWEHSLTARAYGSSEDGMSTNENYKVVLKTTYDFDERNYSFGRLNWNNDRFGSYTRQYFLTAGYGRRILTSETFELKAEIGAGYSKQWPSVGETEEGGTGLVGGDFTWNFSENASFGQRLYVLTASDNTHWESITKLTAGLTNSLALVVSYTVQQNTDAPAGDDKTDTLTSIKLDYSF